MPYETLFDASKALTDQISSRVLSEDFSQSTPTQLIIAGALLNKLKEIALIDPLVLTNLGMIDNLSDLEAYLTLPRNRYQFESIWSNATTRESLVNSLHLMTAVAASPTAMTAVAASPTAMAAVAASSTAMAAVAASSTAMTAIAAHKNAIKAIHASDNAINACISSNVAMNALRESALKTVITTTSVTGNTSRQFIGLQSSGVDYLLIGLSTSDGTSGMTITISTLRPQTTINATISTSTAGVLANTTANGVVAIPLSGSVIPSIVSTDTSVQTFTGMFLPCN